MSIQFSRGCPFQCEFCDIIILYGRKPRTKLPQQVTAELDALLSLGWMKQVFIVDDNFIGNHQRALELCVELEKWQQAHGFPVMFYTEASMDLARKTALVDAMVKANFFYVFLGIESPSKESLQETKKFQNLAVDPVSCIDLLHEKGLWVTGGFIVGFDSDTEDIFDRQIEFIERTAIPWALLNSLHAMPRTALYERMQKEGRLLDGVPALERRHQSSQLSHQIGAGGSAARAGENARGHLRTEGVLRARVAVNAMLEDQEESAGRPAAERRRHRGHRRAVGLASGHQIILPKSLLEIRVEDSQPLRTEPTEDLDGRNPHDLRPPLYSLFPRSRGEDRAGNPESRDPPGTGPRVGGGIA